MRKNFEAILALSADDFASYFNKQVAVKLGRGGLFTAARLTPVEANTIKEIRRDLHEKLKAVRLRKSELGFSASVKAIYPDLEEGHIEAAKAVLISGLDTAPVAGTSATAGAVMSEASPLGSLNAHALGRITSYLAPKGKRRLAQVSKPMSSILKDDFKRTKFLHHVAHGQQDEAEAMLRADASLLTQSGVFTDYSGRSFNCTAYEYAYWAKDTHMCRMLERYLEGNEEAKATLRKRINTMEEIVIDPETGEARGARGLMYWQGGVGHRSTHFDLNPLIAALQRYVDGYAGWEATDNWSAWSAMTAAWLAVGRAQRDVPAHVAQEYCRPDRSFHPTPSFTEETLPRVLSFYNFHTDGVEFWFPFAASPTAGLGLDFSLARGSARAAFEVGGAGVASVDLAAVTSLDVVRAAALTQSRDHLNPPTTSPGLAM